MKLRKQSSSFGFTLVEVLVVIAVSALFLSGLMVSVQFSIQLIANSGAKQSALTIANDRMEYFRSLPYDDVGTVGGVVSGSIPQNSTTTLNNIEFAERVIVEYVDDPADGMLTATTTDSNGISTDYKRIKVEVGWTVGGQADSISLVSNIVPRSIETTSGGGTVRVNVLDADSSFLSGVLSGATVRLLNETTTSTIDTVRVLNDAGVALFSGAPAASNYQVFVSAPGYSSDQTYVATTSNPNPAVAPFTVLAADISTMTFQIGELSDIFMRTLSTKTENFVSKLFSDASGIATSSNIAIAGSKLVLSGTSGSHPSLGETYLTPIAPTSLVGWESVVVVDDTPFGTETTVRFYTGTTSAYSLISEVDLPGNAAGFTEGVIDLSQLDAGSYPNITIALQLESSDPANTPAVDEVTAYYRSSESIRANVGFGVTGAKVIGEEIDLTKINKTVFSTSTNSSGERQLANIEFDSYTFSNTDGLTLAYSCPNLPLEHTAGIPSSIEFVLVPGVSESLRVSVFADSGLPLPGATVSLSRSGYSDSKVSDGCGQVFFSTGISANNDFTLTVNRPGYVTETIDPYDLSGNSEVSVVLNES